MTTINEDGVATLTNKEGDTIKVQISEALISEALKFPTAKKAIKLPYHLSEKEKSETFLVSKGKKETFNELFHKELDLSLCLYSQHFVMGKPPKYTQPCRRVARLMTRAFKKKKRIPQDYNSSTLR